MTPNAACKSCGAPIRWARTERGKGVPLDPEPVADGNLVPDRLVVGLGEIPVRYVAKGEEVHPNIPRYRTHFTTCPDAEEWRNRRKRS